MMGAIIGDIVGSVYEWHNIKTKEFPLFRDDCFFTDDTVMTIAVAEGLMNGGSDDDFINAMKKYGRMYPDSGYGGRFGVWLNSSDRKPYNSWGNGAAMRVSSVGWIMNADFRKVQETAKCCAAITHNHPEGIKGAQATADAIFICRMFREIKKEYKEDYGEELTFLTIDDCKRYVREHTKQEYGYDLSKTLDEIRPTYRFNESCQETVPQAITAFLESTDFEDAIRNAISLGGDSDTLAAITGSIAEAAYDIPQWIKDKAWEYLDEPLRDVCRRWENFQEK